MKKHLQMSYIEQFANILRLSFELYVSASHSANVQLSLITDYKIIHSRYCLNNVANLEHILAHSVFLSELREKHENTLNLSKYYYSKYMRLSAKFEELVNARSELSLKSQILSKKK